MLCCIMVYYGVLPCTGRCSRGGVAAYTPSSGALPLCRVKLYEQRKRSHAADCSHRQSRSLRARLPSLRPAPSLERRRSVNHGLLMTPPTAFPFLPPPQTRATNQHILAFAARLFFCLANKIKKAKHERERVREGEWRAAAVAAAADVLITVGGN